MSLPVARLHRISSSKLIEATAYANSNPTALKRLAHIGKDDNLIFRYFGSTALGAQLADRVTVKHLEGDSVIKPAFKSEKFRIDGH